MAVVRSDTLPTRTTLPGSQPISSLYSMLKASSRRPCGATQAVAGSPADSRRRTPGAWRGSSSAALRVILTRPSCQFRRPGVSISAAALGAPLAVLPGRDAPQRVRRRGAGARSSSSAACEDRLMVSGRPSRMRCSSEPTLTPPYRSAGRCVPTRAFWSDKHSDTAYDALVVLDRDGRGRPF